MVVQSLPNKQRTISRGALLRALVSTVREHHATAGQHQALPTERE